jgi:uncharacterized protein involved in outer membrane biogenesis
MCASPTPWGKAPYLVTAKRLELHVALLPLLRRHFGFRPAAAGRAVVALETNKDGRGAGARGGPALRRLRSSIRGRERCSLGDLAVSGGTLTYRDAAGAGDAGDD